MDLNFLTDIAIKAARDAGNLIRKHFDEDVEILEKQGATSRAAQVLTKVDLACEAIILAQLSPTCAAFDLALLTEESEDDGSRFEKDFFWCVDPMDGTLAFINKRPGFSVSIALVAKDGTPQIGVVYDPGSETLYYATKGVGAFRNGLPWVVEQTNNHFTYVTDQKLSVTPRSNEIESLLENLKGQELTQVKEISGGGSVLNAIRVIENGPACMLKFPKQKQGGGSIWDYAATACIYNELGLRATNFAGGRLDLNKEDGSFMNHEGVFFANLNLA